MFGVGRHDTARIGCEKRSVDIPVFSANVNKWALEWVNGVCIV